MQQPLFLIKNRNLIRIFSNLISFDGALVVSTGIEHQNIDQTIQLIKEQFERCKKGEFSDELISVTKKMIINSLKASRDDMNSISNVSKEAILKAFNACELLATVVLTGKEKAHE